MHYRTEYLAHNRAELETAESRLAVGDYKIDHADELACILGCTTEQQRVGLVSRIANLRAAIARAESMTDAEFGESWEK